MSSRRSHPDAESSGFRSGLGSNGSMRCDNPSSTNLSESFINTVRRVALQSALQTEDRQTG